MREYHLPYPPTVNSYWRHVGHKTLLSARGRAYRKAVLEVVNQTDGLRRKPPMTGRLSVAIHLFPPDRRKRDIDNTIKAVLDGLQHARVYEDDNYIDWLTIIRCCQAKGGKCRITIEELGALHNVQ